MLAETDVGTAEEQPARDRLIHVLTVRGRPDLDSLKPDRGFSYHHNTLLNSMEPKIILITDDDEDDRYFLKQAIESKIEKAVVVEARDGEEALQALSDDSAFGKISLVLLDMNMPRLSGLDVLDYIRSSAVFQHIPTIMISTSDESNLVSDAYTKGINSFIKKPARIDDYEQIAEAIKVCFLGTILSL